MMISGSLGVPLMRLGEELRKRELTVAVAESMTGGLLAASLTDLPDASKRFLGGVVSYTPEKKMEVLAVPPDVITKDGAVSEEAARMMAEGVRNLFQSGIGISVTGVAGPQEEEGKPVGLTYVGVSADGRTEVREYRWPAGRAANRLASVEAAIDLAAHVLSSQPRGQ